MTDVRITGSGCVLLAGRVSCDGFFREASLRVQTHVHLDHMDSFETSKAFQVILTSRGTHALLCAQLNADLPYRSNFVPSDFGAEFLHNGLRVVLKSSGHMLGAAQVQMETEEGLRLGYSGDFSWPLEDVIQVDVLVVDPTYGNPTSIRQYSQGAAESALLNEIRRARHVGPVRILAHQGTLQRAMQVVSGEIGIPMVGSARLLREIAVYRTFGCVIDDVLDVASTEGKEIVKTGCYLRWYGTGDSLPVPDGESTSIKLSAFMSRPDDPVLNYSERSMRVAMSNHADFLGTLEYIQATGARRIVVDASRGGNAHALAEAVSSRLAIECIVPVVETSREWGK